MPLVFGLLIILNAVFMAWQFFQQQNNNTESPVPQSVQMGKPLRLLSETSPSPADTDKQPSASTSPSPRSSGSDTCYRVGPVNNPDMTPQLESALNQAGFSVKIETLTQENTNFWVYIPPQLSRAKADNMLSDLRSRGFKAEMISDPRYANAISLGEFRDQDRADALRGKLLDNGFQAETRRSPVVSKQQWIKVSGVSSGSKVQLDRIVSGSGLRKEPASCEF